MVWLIIALVAGVVEMILPYFTFIFVSIAGFLTFLVGLRFGLQAQLGVFSLTLVASFALFRPWIKMARIPLLPSRAQQRIGQRGIVTTAIEIQGRVLVEDEDWAASAVKPIAQNRRVKVVGSDGIVLIVEEI